MLQAEALALEVGKHLPHRTNKKVQVVSVDTSRSRLLCSTVYPLRRGEQVQGEVAQMDEVARRCREATLGVEYPWGTQSAR